MNTPRLCRFLSMIGALVGLEGSALFGAEALPPAARLPLIERPSTKPTSPVFAVMITGDGGWASIDRAIAEVLNENGISVVGLNAPKYLATLRSADELGKDVAAIVRHYEQTWGKSNYILIGFSRGADLLPFAASRIPADLRDDLKLVTFLGLGRVADFKFRLLDLVHFEPGATSQPVAQELERLRGLKLFFLCGDADADSIASELKPDTGKIITLHGDHHLGGNFPLLGRIIVDELGRVLPAPETVATR